MLVAFSPGNGRGWQYLLAKPTDGRNPPQSCTLRRRMRDEQPLPFRLLPIRVTFGPGTVRAAVGGWQLCRYRRRPPECSTDQA